MKRSLIDLFFMELSKELNRPGEVIVTGAAAGALLGNARPSLDIDFELRVRSSKEGSVSADKAVEEAAKRVGIATNYSEEIGRWSMIDFLDYRKHALPYKKIGFLEVRLMEPRYWTIGKMCRYWALDIEDVFKIVRKHRIPPDDLAEIWGRALKASPLSQSCAEFRDHVADFLKTRGRRLWGPGYEYETTLKKFRSAAGIKTGS